MLGARGKQVCARLARCGSARRRSRGALGVMKINGLASWVTACAAWSVALFSLWYFLRVWLAPDGCLDAGGSFDYAKWECNDHVNTFIKVSVFELPAFWLFVGCLVGAIYVQRKSAPHRAQQAASRDRSKTRST